MQNSETKTCPICCESIKANARKCPYCHQWQSKWYTTTLHPTFQLIFLGLPFLLLWIASVMWLENSFLIFKREGREIEPHRDQIRIVESHHRYDVLGESPSVSTVGKIKNESPFAWSNLGLEVQYFDGQSKLIDADNCHLYGKAVLPGDEAAFIFKKDSVNIEEDYVSHKVFVRWAEEPDSWP